MSEGGRSSTSLVVGFIIIALAGIAGNYAIDMYRRDGRAAATRINNDLRAAEQNLADLGAAEASYIAAGQNAEAANTWMNAATSLSTDLEGAIANLAAASTSAAAKAHYDAATPLVSSLTANDRKARGLVASGQSLVAADVVLIEGADTVKQLKTELAAARDAEMAGFEEKAARLGWIGLGANGAAMFLGLVLLIVAGRRSAAPAETGATSLNSFNPAPASAQASAGKPAHPAPEHPGTPSPAHPDPWFAPAPDLSGAADLCVDLGRVQDGSQLAALLSRAATVLEAKGIVLWVCDPGGAVLRPTLSHGYSDKVLQRMGTLTADGDNVTSLAFRTKQPQVVRGSIDGQGALAVPLLAGSGCIGVLAAEVQGAKPGDARFAIARIIAAQLSTLVAPAAATESPKTAAKS